MDDLIRENREPTQEENSSTVAIADDVDRLPRRRERTIWSYFKSPVSVLRRLIKRSSTVEAEQRLTSYVVEVRTKCTDSAEDTLVEVESGPTGSPPRVRIIRITDKGLMLKPNMNVTVSLKGRSSLDAEEFVIYLMRQASNAKLDIKYLKYKDFSIVDLGISSNYKPMSEMVSASESFVTASSPGSFYSAQSSRATPVYDYLRSSVHPRLGPIIEIPASPLGKIHYDYRTKLQQAELFLDPLLALDWSGKGQHVTFEQGEVVPLKILASLGATHTASVDKVLCRRVALARKTMRCTRQWKIEDALREVEHLHKLQHSHIVQLVGTYLQQRDFSVLMYPAAEWHLGVFLEDTADMGEGFSITESKSGPLIPLDNQVIWAQRRAFLRRSLECLLSALAFIHHTTRHEDIKPANILVKDKSVDCKTFQGHIYLADFGLSRNFVDQDHTQTDGPTARTPKYCAPEVYHHDSRGRSADMFSMGCVFSEIFTVSQGYHVHEFSEFRSEKRANDHFRDNIDKVTEWLQYMRKRNCISREVSAWGFDALKVIDLTNKMVQHDPKARPTANDAFAFIQRRSDWPLNCCDRGPEPYVAYTSNEDSVKGSINGRP